MSPEEYRRHLVRLVHVARQDRQLDEDDYRALLKRVTGKSSCNEMDHAELDRVLAAFREIGFKVRHRKGRAVDTSAQAQKLRALWLEMADLGIVRDRSEAALCSWAANSRSPKVTALLQAWTGKEFDEAIERLKKWRIRELMSGMFVCPDCSRVYPPSEQSVKHFPGLICHQHGDRLPELRWTKQDGPAQPR
jgi:phage gp16-like protein